MAPVIDHPVHNKVKHDKPQAGCFNRKMMGYGYYAKVRDYSLYGTYEYKDQFVLHLMSTKCRQINDLPECEGCTAEKDVDYIERMKQL